MQCGDGLVQISRGTTDVKRCPSNPWIGKGSFQSRFTTEVAVEQWTQKKERFNTNWSSLDKRSYKIRLFRAENIVNFHQFSQKLHTKINQTSVMQSHRCVLRACRVDSHLASSFDWVSRMSRSTWKTHPVWKRLNAQLEHCNVQAVYANSPSQWTESRWCYSVTEREKRCRGTYRFPRWLISTEQWARQLHAQTLFVILWLVLGHPEQHSCCIRSCKTTQNPRDATKFVKFLKDRIFSAFGFQINAFNIRWRGKGQHLPTPSLRECRSSVSGAVAPSCSITSAPSFSAASSHSTPDATRWMFSMGEYNSCNRNEILHSTCFLLKQRYAFRFRTVLLTTVLCAPERRAECNWGRGWRLCCVPRALRCAALPLCPRRSPPCAHRPRNRLAAGSATGAVKERAQQVSQCHQSFLLESSESLSITRVTLSNKRTFCVSWWALMRSWTMRGMAPCSLSGAWFAGQRAKFRIRPAWKSTLSKQTKERISDRIGSQNQQVLFPYHCLKQHFSLKSSAYRQQPWWVASGWVGEAVWRGPAVRSAGARRSVPSRPPGGDSSSGAGHRPANTRHRYVPIP